MLISKHHLLTRHTASKDATRALLMCLEIRKDGDEIVAVATDGYVLSEVREATPPDDEFPSEQEGVDKARISAKSAAKASTVMKPSKHLPVLNYAQASAGGLIVTDLDRTMTFADGNVEGEFPDYEKLIPSSADARVVVTVNPKYLMRALKVFGDETSVELELHGGVKPVVLRSNNAGRQILGVVMPIKS